MMNTPSPHVSTPSSDVREGPARLVPLSDAINITEFGGKAARQAALIQAGFAVPEGFVVPCGAFREWQGGDDLPPAVTEMLVSAAEQLGYPLAVRSSGLAEDLDDASFAGMYATVLNVDSAEGVKEAVIRCWRSARAGEIGHYRSHKLDDGGEAAMAVILQKMVPADVAGVAFTADPRTGDRSRMVIEAVRGLGESLVSGEAAPERWVVQGDESTREEGLRDVLRAEQVSALADVFTRVAEHQGAPQDIEWAMRGSEIFILQTRPITTLPDVEPIPIPLDAPPGDWGLETTHYEAPLSPFYASFYLPTFNRIVNDTFQEFGMPMERFEKRLIGGWAYVAMFPSSGGKAPPPAWLMGLLARIIPGLRKANQKARTYQEEGRDRVYVETWHSTWADACARGVDELDEVEVEALDDAELLAHLRQCFAMIEEVVGYHWKLHPPGFLALAELVFFCRRIPGWTEAETIGLLAGSSEISAEPGRKIAAIARAIEANPQALAIARDNAPDALLRIRAMAPEIGVMFDDFQHRCGLRPLDFDPISLTLRERPQRTWNLVRGQLEREAEAEESGRARDARRDEALARARASFDDPSELERFEALLAHARRTYPVREASEFWAFCVNGLIRLALLEVGRRMKTRDHLARAEHVFFMEKDEILDWLVGHQSRRDKVDHRRGERLWALANRPPAHIGPKPQGFPDPRLLPAPLRRVAEAVFWVVANDNDAPAPQGEALAGTGASSGRYTGPARIILDIADFDRVRPGDVLVCQMTTSSWSTLFSHLGAIITDTGGMLSHPAIIAREFGIPAVIGVGDGTTRIKDGQIVTVDGSTGRVEVSQ